jgi:potassium uptake TrkH family protein
MLPRATDSSIGISFVDALFTSTSAVCVTGLTSVDTAKVFTPLGKVIIISLIQVGGLGVMTLTTFFAFLLAGGLSIKARVIMRELLSHENIDEVKSLLMKILLYTVVVECIGAVILYFNTASALSAIDHKAFYYAIFHAVSAFCNAGFSLYSENLMHKDVLNNYAYLSTIMLLIVVGGIGFLTQSNLIQFFKSKRKNRKLLLTVNTKIILITTACLIFIGSGLLYFVEPFSFNPHLSGFERWMHSMFLSVTARTAGYNSVPTELLSNTSTMIMIMLMWIGASPGSTGGGIKTTTFALVIKTLLSVIQGKERVEIFKREIPADNLKQAFLVFICSILVLGFSCTLLVYIEPNKDPLSLIFEAVSAIGTVGLSRNLTFYLGDGAKIVLTLLMFIGRVGVLTFFLSLYKPKHEPRYRLPNETIMVG